MSSLRAVSSARKTIKTGNVRSKKPKSKEWKVKNPYHYNEIRATPFALMKEDIYQPETAKAKKLGLLANRLVHFDLHDPELLERYSQHAAQLAPGMGPKQYGLILNAMARTGHKNEKMLEAFAAHMIPKLMDFLPIDLAQTSNAYAKLEFPHRKLFKRLAEEIPHKLSYFNAPEIAMVANAFTRVGMSIEEKALLEDIADETADRIEEFGGQAITMVIHALASAEVNRPIAWETILMHVTKVGDALEDSEWVQIVNAAVKAHHQSFESIPESFFKVAGTQFVKRSKNLDMKQLALAISSFARAGRFDVGFFTAAGRRITEEIENEREKIDNLTKMLGTQKFETSKHSSVDVVSLGRIMHAISRLQISDSRLHENLVFKVSHLELDTPLQTVVLSLNGLSRLRIIEPGPYLQCAKILSRSDRTKDLSPQGVALVCHAFAKAGVKSNLLFHMLSRNVEREIGLYKGQSIAMVAWSFARLNIQHATLPQLLAKYTTLLLSELTLNEATSIKTSLETLGALTPALDVKLTNRITQLQGDISANNTFRNDRLEHALVDGHVTSDASLGRASSRRRNSLQKVLQAQDEFLDDHDFDESSTFSPVVRKMHPMMRSDENEMSVATDSNNNMSDLNMESSPVDRKYLSRNRPYHNETDQVKRLHDGDEANDVLDFSDLLHRSPSGRFQRNTHPGTHAHHIQNVTNNNDLLVDEEAALSPSAYLLQRATKHQAAISSELQFQVEEEARKIKDFHLGNKADRLKIEADRLRAKKISDASSKLALSTEDVKKEPLHIDDDSLFGSWSRGAALIDEERRRDMDTANSSRAAALLNLPSNRSERSIANYNRILLGNSKEQEDVDNSEGSSFSVPMDHSSSVLKAYARSRKAKNGHDILEEEARSLHANAIANNDVRRVSPQTVGLVKGVVSGSELKFGAHRKQKYLDSEMDLSVMLKKEDVYPQKNKTFEESDSIYPFSAETDVDHNNLNEINSKQSSNNSDEATFNTKQSRMQRSNGSLNSSIKDIQHEFEQQQTQSYSSNSLIFGMKAGSSPSPGNVEVGKIQGSGIEVRFPGVNNIDLDNYEVGYDSKKVDFNEPVKGRRRGLGRQRRFRTSGDDDEM